MDRPAARMGAGSGWARRLALAVLLGAASRAVAAPPATEAGARPPAAPAPSAEAPVPAPAAPPSATPPPAAPAATPTSVLEAAPAADWTPLPADTLMVMDLARGGRVVVALAPEFAPVHVANVRAMARAGFYDGLPIERVQDDYVTQWGDPTEKKPLPPTVVPEPPAEYERAAAGLAVSVLPYRDTYAALAEFAGPFPVASDGDRAWLAHCYGMVGVGRGLNPSTGSGSELYAVNGQPPRALDRNIAVVGRVVSGMPALAALPRGTAALGFYATEAERLPITRVRMADDMAIADRPRIEVLNPASASFAAWLRVRANRRDDFFLRPAGAVDLCGAMPPVRIDGRLPGAAGK